MEVDTINTPLPKQGRPIGSGGKYTRNPNQKPRKNPIGKYAVSPRVKTPEEMEELKHKKRASSLAYYNRNRAEILRARAEEAEKLEAVEQIVKSIRFKLTNQDTATINHINKIIETQMSNVRLFFETFAEQ